MQAMTVNGLVSGDDLGIVLPHEHLYSDCRFYCTGGETSSTPLHRIPRETLRAAPMDYLENLDMRDESAVREEVALFRRAGGATLVELTTKGLSPDHGVLRRISIATGVNIIAGTGYYVASSLTAGWRRLSVGVLADELVRAIEEGDAATGIKAGIIGEIGTSDPIQDSELNVIRAAARAQVATNCPINVHFSAGLHEVFTVFDALESEGLTTLEKVVVSHADDVLDVAMHKRIMALGAFIEYDTFGNEAYPNQVGNRMPTDRQRVTALAELIAAGLVDQLLISHDVCMKSQWRLFGGTGYVNLLERVPPMFEEDGVTAADLRTMMVTNPARLLAFVG